MDVLVYWPLSVLQVFACVYVILNQSTNKKTHYLSDLCKLDALLYTLQGPSSIKVKRLDMCRSIISLGKTPQLIWHDLPFSKRNKAIKRAVGYRLEVKERQEVDKI